LVSDVSALLPFQAFHFSQMFPPRWRKLNGLHGLNAALWIGASTWKFTMKANAIIITTAKLGARAGGAS
jgi:hypothetical protein